MGETNLDPTKVIEYKRKRHIPVPQCPIGWCVAVAEDIDLRLESGLYMPSGGETAMQALAPEQQKPPQRYRIVATAKQYPVNATSLADTPFEVGDYVLPTVTGRNCIEMRASWVLPEKHVAFWIADLGPFRKCAMGEPTGGKA